MINLKTSERTGKVVAIKSVQEDEQLMVITRNGVVNRQPVSEISVIGRATQGVKLVNLDEGDTVVDVARVVTDDETGVDETGVEGTGVEKTGVEETGADENGVDDDDVDGPTEGGNSP